MALDGRDPRVSAELMDSPLADLMTDEMIDAEIDVLVAQLEAAGLIETHRNPDDKISCHLTRTGDQLGRIARGAAQVPHPPR